MSFKYFGSNKDLYEGVSLEIKKNKHTVIVGANGSAKVLYLDFYQEYLSLTRRYNFLHQE